VALPARYALHDTEGALACSAATGAESGEREAGEEAKMLDHETRQSEQRRGIGRAVGGWLFAVVGALATALFAFAAVDYATTDNIGDENAVGQFILGVIGFAAIACGMAGVALLRSSRGATFGPLLITGFAMALIGALAGMTLPVALSIAGWAVAVAGLGVAIVGLVRG
jgi:hypothetical protein